MARVTVEDCLEYVEDRFDLVLIAAKRAHQLNSGAYKSVLDVGKDKPAVIALREIEAGLIDASILSENFTLKEEFSAKDEVQSKVKMEEVQEELSEVSIDVENDDIVNSTDESSEKID